MKITEYLRSIGLTKYEAEVYCTLVKTGRAKVQDLVKMTSVPRPHIYTTLKSLLRKGMCIEGKGNVNHYSAVAPLVAFGNILQNEKERLNATINELQELNKVYKNHKKTDVPFEFIQVLKGNQLLEFFFNMELQAEKEILIFCKYYAQPDKKSIEASVKREIKTLKRGVKYRCLYQASGLYDSKFLLYSKTVLYHGEIGRVINFLPMNLMIVDDRVIFSLTHKGEKEVTAFVFNHPALVSVMKGAFEYFWSKGSDINKSLYLRSEGTAINKVLTKDKNVTTNEHG
jgi:sugar-specific transcriptional regulator TrmB